MEMNFLTQNIMYILYIYLIADPRIQLCDRFSLGLDSEKYKLAIKPFIRTTILNLSSYCSSRIRVSLVFRAPTSNTDFILLLA